MDKEALFEKARSIAQQHVLEYYDKLPPKQQLSLLEQIDQINIPTFRLQQQQLLEHHTQKKRLFEPFTKFTESGNEENIALGRELIAQGKVGCVLIAGGMATRLKYNGPKGTFPISLIQKKSLFQLFAEKVIAAGVQANRLLPIAIMTSPLNHAVTVQYFKENQNFGLKEEQLFFFTQGTLPILNHEGNLFLDAPNHICKGPDGNGSSLQHFYHSGLWKKWYDQGVRKVNYVLVDNPLADPFDPELVTTTDDVVIKCTSRKDPNEKVGVLVKIEDKTRVIEYTELPEEERDINKHKLANLSLFNFSMDFIKKQSKVQLPLHLAHKALPTITNRHPSEPNAWKFEQFIFDLLPLALTTSAIVYPRKQCFAPLKNSSGENSAKIVQAALQKRDREVFEVITGTTPPECLFELDQQFYYPTPLLLEKWKGRELPNEDYILS